MKQQDKKTGHSRIGDKIKGKDKEQKVKLKAYKGLMR